MSTLESRLEPASETFTQDRDAMIAKVEAGRALGTAGAAKATHFIQRCCQAQALRAQLDAESSALFGTARARDDGLIGMALTICREAASRVLRPSSFGVARP